MLLRGLSARLPSRSVFAIFLLISLCLLSIILLSPLRVREIPSVLYNYSPLHKGASQREKLANQPPATPPPPLSTPRPLPKDYDIDKHESDFCRDNFSGKYLEDIRDQNIQYCTGGSTSTLTCFHSHAGDSMCIGSGAKLAGNKFVLGCDIRSPDAKEAAQGLIGFNAIRGYWYETGPRVVFDKWVGFESSAPAPPPVASNELGEQGTLEQVEERQKRDDGDNSTSSTPRTFVLLKREGEVNPWHCLLEIWSMSMTLDVLSMSRDPASPTGLPFLQPDDFASVQPIVLDERLVGPYWDLWSLMGTQQPIYLKDIDKHPDIVGALAVSTNKIIVPLAGATNPIWKTAWDVQDCPDQETLRAFTRRVKRHYGVPETQPEPRTGKVRLTYVDRQSTRRIANSSSHLNAVRARFPDVDVVAVDFEALSMAEQVRTAEQTDILVGVHGAGLIHELWMDDGLGAVVEVTPQRSRLAGNTAIDEHDDVTGVFRGFRDMARMKGLHYVRAQAAAAQGTQGGDWHGQDVEIEEARFVELIGVAVRGLYQKWDHNVVKRKR